MTSWTPKIEEDLTLLIKEWLKTQNRTQADLKTSLNASSSRMPVLLEILKEEHKTGGMTYVISKLSRIESEWCSGKNETIVISHQEEKRKENDPFSQLDLILQELKDK